MRKIFLLGLTFWMVGCAAPIRRTPLVMMTDFGISDGAVSEMRGVAYTIDPALNISDLTHYIPPYNIWDGAYRLQQTMIYWPSGTVFVCVIDPGVGSERRSVVAKLKTGHYFVGPDNGLLMFVDEMIGVTEVRIIDEKKYRRPGSENSHTFHGRDVYTYTGAQLASGKIHFEDVGPISTNPIVKIAYQKAHFENNTVEGNIPALDPNYGNVWTNVSGEFLTSHLKSATDYEVEIFNENKKIYAGKMPMVKTFSAVPQGKPLMYINSLMNVSFALNMDNFSKLHNISSGQDWHVKISEITK